MELPAVRAPRRSWTQRSSQYLCALLSPPRTSTPTATTFKRALMTSTTSAHADCCSVVKPVGSHGSATTDTRSSVSSSLRPSLTDVSTPVSPSPHYHQQQAHATHHHNLLVHLRRRSEKDRPKKLTLPHTITERHGGRDLWVTAPVLEDELEKQGFRWRKKWKTRFVELNGRILSYYEINPRSGLHHAPKPRKSVHLTADALLQDVNDLTFSLIPSPGERAWVFRARDAKTKLKWCKALVDCIDILIWLQHYEVGDVLGVGGNGVVKLLVDKRDGRRYAVKVVDASKFKNRAAVVSEVEILRNITNDIRHPNLVKIHKVYEEQEKIYMILDLCEGGELYDAVVKRGCYSEADAANIMKQLMSALQALHRHNILHLDLKPENILLSSKDASEAKIILTDFGLARMVNGKQNPLETGKTMAGTIGYIAPEVIAAHTYTEAADVFSAGVILFILLVGYPPFYGDSEVEILLKIARGDFQFHAEDWSHISTPAKELVARMLEVRMQDRITVDEVLNHPWLVEMTGASVEPRAPLAQTQQRMQQFNFERKTENMASCMASMLGEDNEADFQALVDVQAIGMLIRQLSPSGTDRLALDKAIVLTRRLGLSPHVDVHSFVAFLDRDGDGFISAQDFCEGVRAMREGHSSFANIIYAALLRLVGAPHLTLGNLRSAFDHLECPADVSAAFFKYIDEHPRTNDDVIANDVKTTTSISDPETISEDEFVGLFHKFKFVGLLFMVKAKSKIMVIARPGSAEELPDIAEELRESLME